MQITKQITLSSNRFRFDILLLLAVIGFLCFACTAGVLQKFNPDSGVIVTEEPISFFQEQIPFPANGFCR